MNYTIGSLVKRKVGGVIGVLMASAPAEGEQTGFACEVAFGYLTIDDAQQNKAYGTKWENVHSCHLEMIGG